jgi:hypothetical protein
VVSDPDIDDNESLTVSNITQPNLPGAALTCPSVGPVSPPATLTCSLNLPALSFTTAGTYTASLSGFDGSLTTTQSITITVGNVNRPPVLTTISNQAIAAGQTINVPLSATDPDPEDTNITFSVSNVSPAPAGLTFTPSGKNTAGNLQIVAAANVPPQILTVTVQANDNDAKTPQAPGSGPLTATTQFLLAVNAYMIVDDTSGLTLLFDQAGNYYVINCRKSPAPLFSGAGTIAINGCKVTLLAGTGKGATQSVNATVNTCTKVASATVNYAGQTFTLNDANVTNDTLCH